MRQDNQSKQSLRTWRTWLLLSTSVLLLLMVAAILIVPRSITSDSIKQKIQAAVAEHTGSIVDFQMIDFSYFPQPAIELRQVSLILPDQAQGTAASLRVFPKVLSLLTGNLQLARLELEMPRFSLELPESKTEIQPLTLASLEKHLSSFLERLDRTSSDLKLRINNAGITIEQDKQKVVDINGMDLQFSMSADHFTKASLRAKLSELRIYPNNHDGNTNLRETIKDISLDCGVQWERDRITITLDQLTAVGPSLELAGDLILARAAGEASKVHLSGTNIDVEAVRATALAVAGENILVREVFDYLRGGRVSQINFTSYGENLLELGDFDSILIEGQLQDGKVSIPEIKLDLTEVIGDVVIDKGVLQGTGISARYDDTTGHDGSFKIGITEDSDLFQLNLLLRADLANVHSILQRVITNETFRSELQKVSNLQGIGHGRLILGDSLDNIDVTVEIRELALSTDFQRVPWPIKITQGRFAFNENQIDLGMLSGTLGQSRFTDFTARILWEEDLLLDIDSGSFDLDMTQLYPWTTSLHDRLENVRQVSGQLHLSALKFKGILDQPAEWDFTSIGTVNGLSVDTELFPETITFASGGFSFDTRQLTFEKLQTAGQDSELILTGSLNGFPQQLNRIELSLDGSIGPNSVKWLSDILEVPESYATHSPLSISDAQVSWQPDSTASFKGVISTEKGPAITADIDYRPEQLQVRQLTVKDQHSDADLVFDLNRDQRNFRFTGKLSHETLHALFINRQFNSGRLEGDFAITIPQNRLSEATASGQLFGENLNVLLPSGEMADIEQVTLNADGSQVIVDIPQLTWKGLIWKPVKAAVSFDRNRTDIEFIEARLCGIDSLGSVSITGNEFLLNTTLEGKKLDVATSYTCLTKGRVKMTGSLDFFGRINAKGEVGKLVEALQGPLEMTFRNGIIQQDKLLARTLEVLNVTEIVKGRLPDLNTTGLAYTTMTLQGEFQDGKLIIDKFFMDGETLHLVGNGEILLEKQTINAQLLAAPFRTIDSIVKNIPGINYLLAGNLVTIPIRITGLLTDPKVEVMAVSAVGSNLYNLAERTIKAPFKLIDAIIPWGDQNKE
jgi:hypothetical protein